MQRQLETLGAQRAGLEDMLKEMKRKVCFIVLLIILLLTSLCVSVFSVIPKHGHIQEFCNYRYCRDECLLSSYLIPSMTE